MGDGVVIGIEAEIGVGVGVGRERDRDRFLTSRAKPNRLF